MVVTLLRRPSSPHAALRALSQLRKSLHRAGCAGRVLPELKHWVQLLNALSDVRKELPDGKRLKLCVSSRIDREAQKVLVACSSKSIRADTESIREFITSRIWESPTLSRRASQNAELEDLILDEIAERSDRM